MPKIAGGSGSITGLSLRIGASYRLHGHEVGYLSANCAAPAGFRIALFPLARADFYLGPGLHLQTTISRSCSVR